MVNGAEAPQPTLGDLLEWVGRRWLILVLAVLVGAAGSWGFAQLQPKSYTSTTLVQVRPVGPDASADSRINLDTEAQVVKSMDTASRAHDLMGATVSAAELARRVTVLVPPNTTFLEISYEASSPERAQEGAHAFAEAYLVLREEGAQAEVNERIDRLGAQIESLRTQGADEQVVLPLLNQQLLLQSEPINGGDVRSPANLPALPSSPNYVLFVASGLVAGLLLGLSVALVVHRLDRRVFRASDLPEGVADQVLLELRGSRPAAQVLGPATAMGRQFSRLRNVMRASADAALAGASSGRSGQAAGVLLVCGVTPGSASGFVTANLAAAFARAGERVVVVGGDPSSSAFEALGVATAPGRGLSDVIAGQVAPADATVPSAVIGRVSVLRPGRLDEQAELAVGEMMGVVLRLASGADRVIIEAAPMTRSIDAQALGVTASALLLVVESQRTHSADVAAAVRDFQQVRAPFAGLLLVPPAGRNRRRRPVPAARIVPTFLEPQGESTGGAAAAPGPTRATPSGPVGSSTPPPAAAASGPSASAAQTAAIPKVPSSHPDDTVVLGRIRPDRSGDHGAS